MALRSRSSAAELELALAALDAGLGSARKLHVASSSSGLSVAVGRWRHDGASIALDAIAPARLILSLNGGQRLHWHRDTESTTAIARCGSTAIVRYDPSARIDIEGRGDTLQILVSRAERGRPPSPAVSPSSARHRSLDLRALAARAMVVLKAGDVRRLDALLGEIAPLIVAPALRPSARIRGGVTPSVLPRMKDEIWARLHLDPESLPSVRDLADQADLSVWHFIRAFKASEGVTPHVWMAEQRRERALSLLLETGSSVSDTAFASGYGSAAHFVAAFRRDMGVTPGQLQDAVLSD